MGYGDKEMYWIAATIAQEKFSLEPFMEGNYGDCGGVFHFDPTEITVDVLKKGKIPDHLEDGFVYTTGKVKESPKEKASRLARMADNDGTRDREVGRDKYTGVMPHFLNGQFVAEKVECVGAMVEFEMSKPRLATPAERIMHLKGRSERTGAPRGACAIARGCVDVPADYNEMIYKLQRYQISRVGYPKSWLAGRVAAFWEKLWAKITPAWV